MYLNCYKWKMENGGNEKEILESNIMDSKALSKLINIFPSFNCSCECGSIVKYPASFDSSSSGSGCGSFPFSIHYIYFASFWKKNEFEYIFWDIFHLFPFCIFNLMKIKIAFKLITIIIMIVIINIFIFPYTDDWWWHGCVYVLQSVAK